VAQLQPYEAVIFDFDGVLVDSEPVHYQCWLDILKPHGVTLDWKTYSDTFIGISDRSMVSLLCEQTTPPLEFDRLWAEYPRKKELFRERMNRADAIEDVVLHLVSSLRPHYKLAVVTSSGQREVEPILAATGMLSRLDTVVYGGDVKNLKPAPDPYLLAVERLGVSRAIAIEDSKAGIASARAAGLDVIELSRQSELTQAVLARVSLPQAEARAT
jgi:beta-phosphoglucomutase